MRRLIAWILLPSCLAACATWEVQWETQGVSPQQVVAQERPSVLHVTLSDGFSMVLIEPRISRDSLTGILGHDRVYQGRRLGEGLRMTVHLGDVARIAVPKKEDTLSRISGALSPPGFDFPFPRLWP